MSLSASATNQNTSPQIIPPLFTSTDSNSSTDDLFSVPDISPFFLIDHGAILNYSPVVLIPNPDWYDNKSIDYSSESYIVKIKVNETEKDFSEFDHDYLVAVGVEWDVSSYGLNSFHSLNYSVYSDDNITLLASDVIDVAIQLEEQPPIDYVNSKIEIGIFDYFHNTYPSDFQYAIYPDGLVLYSIFGSEKVNVYEGWITEDKYKELIDMIWSYNFFNFKNYYFGPMDSYAFDVDYYTEVELGSSNHTKFFKGLTSPLVAAELWDLIKDEVESLNYIPREGLRLFGVSGFWGLTWKWWFTIFGSTIGLVIVGVFFKRFRS
jgi:hypothetical protein